MSAAIPAVQSSAHSTGPKTPQGKAIASRNVVTHGLHAPDAVLPHLGESQAEFDALRGDLTRQLSPHTAVESHYVTQIAQATWRLRRLTRWEQCLYDGPALKALSSAPTICQNEPTSDHSSSPVSGEVASLGEPEGVLLPEGVLPASCQPGGDLFRYNRPQWKQNC